MKSFSTIENPFVEPKHRNPDNAELVGKILGAEAEAAMRRVVADKAKSANNADQKWDLALISEQRAKRAGEKEQREHARRELLAWIEEVGVIEKTGETVESLLEGMFTFHTDGTVTVEGELRMYRDHDADEAEYNIFENPHCFPPRVRRVTGSVDLGDNNFESLKGFPESVGENIYIGDPHGGNIHIKSLDGLPPPEKVGGAIIFRTYFDANDALIEEARRRGYRVETQASDAEQERSNEEESEEASGINDLL